MVIVFVCPLRREPHAGERTPAHISCQNSRETSHAEIGQNDFLHYRHQRRGDFARLSPFDRAARHAGNGCAIVALAFHVFELDIDPNETSVASLYACTPLTNITVVIL